MIQFDTAWTLHEEDRCLDIECTGCSLQDLKHIAAAVQKQNTHGRMLYISSALKVLLFFLDGQHSGWVLQKANGAKGHLDMMNEWITRPALG